MIDNCPFLEYKKNSGIFGASHRCKKTEKDIYTGEKLLKDYCQAGEKYFSQCPHFKPEPSSSGCYLTSACVDAMGLGDDCFELTTLRGFRDRWLVEQPFGKEEIAEYYRIAPQIVRAIHNESNSHEILECIYNDMITPCVQLIMDKKYAEAHALYRSKTQEFKSIYLGQ